jgi:hypothetical protein
MMRSATLILDSSVLLNLYRYPKQARDDFLTVLRSVKERLWIPYQVAVEFQENRLAVIADQVARFDDVRKLVNSAKQSLISEFSRLQLNKRHSVIDPDTFLQKFEGLVAGFLGELQRLEENHPDVFHEDELRDSVDELLEGRIGQPPAAQEWLDELYADGRKRFQRQIPPGYKDV